MEIEKEIKEIKEKLEEMTDYLIAIHSLIIGISNGDIKLR